MSPLLKLRRFLLAFALGLAAPAAMALVDTDGDGIDDVGGVTLYSTSFDTADAGWAFNGQWSRVSDAAAARTPSYVATACTLGIIQCRFPPTMTLTYTLPQASRISFWAKSASSSGSTQQFYVDNAPAGYFSANKYSYTQSGFLVGAGTHVFKWTISAPTSFGQPYIDDVSITTVTDNCTTVPNADQLDIDKDGQGDACDPDSDNDGVLDDVDNCRLFANTDQLNTDGDAQGNVCDSDDDNDGAPDGNDRWPLNPAAHNDPDSDLFPDSWAAGCDATCQAGSGLVLDNCPAANNPNQLDSDGDAAGDACDTDDDGDGVADVTDNCPLLSNVNQQNTDGDGQGDVCDVLPQAADRVVQLVSGHDFSCVLNSLGGVKCWGNNNYGQLGDGTRQNRTRPVDVVGLGSGVKAIFAGAVNACAIMSTGGLKCWGNNGQGQQGDGTQVNNNVPVNVFGLDAGVKSVAIGEWHVCALMDAGHVKCWGQNGYGQFGNGVVSAGSSVPVDVAGLAGIQAITAGYSHNCVITAAGGVQCWGYGANGEMGDGFTQNRLSPVDVSGMASGVIAIESTSYSNCAKLTGNGLKCWGNNQMRESGSGMSDVRYTTPVDVVGISEGVSVFAGGGGHYCAVTLAGEAKCWGLNTSGQLGNGLKTNSNTPVTVVGLGNDNDSVAPGSNSSCALKKNGAVLCWGANASGQLGDNGNTDRLTPQLVYGLAGDTDADGIADSTDPDDDNDGTPDYIDAAPQDAGNSAERVLLLGGSYNGSSVREAAVR